VFNEKTTRFIFLLLVIFGIAVALRLADRSRPVPPQIAVNNIQWGAKVDEESQKLAQLNLQFLDGPEGTQVYENSDVEVWVSRAGLIEAVKGDSLYIDGTAVLRKGQPTHKIPEDFKTFFEKLAVDKRGLYGIAISEGGVRHLIICDVNEGVLGSFYADPLPPPNSPIENDYPYNLLGEARP